MLPNKLNSKIKALPLALGVLLLAACGGGGGGGSSAPVSTTISGTASKGTFKNAIVTAFQVKADGTKGDKIKEVRTDAAGKYNIEVSGYTGPVLLEMSGDASTKMVCDIPAGCEGGVAFSGEIPAATLALKSVLPALQGGTIQSAITPFTHLAAEFALSKTGQLSKSNIDAALTQIQDLFDLPNLNATQPADATKALPAGDLDAQRYALMNAAIGQLGGGTLAGIQAKLQALVGQLSTKNGQLLSSEASGNAVVDLADVLGAAQAVQGAGKLMGLNDLIKSALSQQLQEALASTVNTTAEPSTNAGAADLTKAKAFARSVGKFADNLRALDNANLDTVLRDRVKTLDTMADAHALIEPAVGAALAVLGEAALSEDATSHTLNQAGVQEILTEWVNDDSIKVTAGAGMQLVVDRTARTVTLNGAITIQPLRTSYVWNGAAWVPQSVNDGASMTFTVTGLKLVYPSETTATTMHELIISPGGKVASTDLQFSFPAATDSRMQITYATAKSINARDAEEEAESPQSVLIKFDRVELKALKAPASEFSSFVGSAEWKAVKAMLAEAHGAEQREWPMPDTTSLKGTFSSVNGDVMEAALSITYAGSNPKVSPEEGHVRSGMFTYRYDAAAKIAYLSTNAGIFGAGRYYGGSATQLNLKMASHSPTCLTAESLTLGVLWLGCHGSTTVPGSLKAMMDSGWTPYELQAHVENEGDYMFPASLNFNSASNVTVNGVLAYSSEDFVEDATHFARPVLSLTTKIKLPGTDVDFDASITAKRTAFEGGEFTAVLRQGADKLTITSPVVGGEPAISLTNLDGVKVDIGVNEESEKVAIKLNGKELGWIYTLNGLPVARFTDNSLMAL
jgi:hypothetical protein